MERLPLATLLIHSLTSLMHHLAYTNVVIVVELLQLFICFIFSFTNYHQDKCPSDHDKCLQSVCVNHCSQPASHGVERCHGQEDADRQVDVPAKSLLDDDNTCIHLGLLRRRRVKSEWPFFVVALFISNQTELVSRSLGSFGFLLSLTALYNERDLKSINDCNQGPINSKV